MTPFDGRLCQDKCDAVAEEGKRQTEEHRSQFESSSSLTGHGSLIHRM